MSSASLPSLRNSFRLFILASTIVAASLAFAAESRAALVGAGQFSSCGIKQSGALACWGTNSKSALGDGANSPPSYDPLPVQGLGSGVTDISVGHGDPTACAIASGGARCWGSNGFGKLGNGTTGGESNTPVQVTGLGSGVTKISVNEDHVCAAHNGAAKCWGSGHAHRLGNLSSADQNLPVTATGLESGVTDIAAGWRHTCAIKAGTIMCWGDNTNSQLGHGGGSNDPLPLTSPPPGQALRIAAGVDLSCALMDSGAVYCWGSNGNGKLGAGIAPGGEFVNPSLVTGMDSGVSDIHTNDNHACAIKAGTAFCWGDGPSGKLGNGASDDSNVPVQVSNISGVTSIAAGNSHTCAVASGKHYCWGSNTSRQLGADVGSSSSVPVEVPGMTPPPPDGDVDGVPDAQDNCPTVTNGDQADLDGSGGGDVCDGDDDGDGVGDDSDACPRQSGSASNGCPDGDVDGVPDTQDNCPTVANGDQADLNGSGGGDACDGDDDGDGVADSSDACPRQSGPASDGCAQRPPPTPPKPKLVTTKAAPKPLLGGGKAITVTPNQPCQLTSSSRILIGTRPRTKSAALTLPAPTRVFGTLVTVPKTLGTTFVANTPVVIPVRPVTLPARPLPTTNRQPNPPPVRVQTTTTCKPIFGAIFNPSIIGFGAPPYPIRFTTGTPAVVKTTTTVNPPAAPPINERKLKTGAWGGKIRGLQTGAANGIKFTVDSQGKVSNLVASIAEKCYAPGNQLQGPTITSVPRFTNLQLARPMASTGFNGGFPRSVVFKFQPPPTEAAGTKSISLGSGNVPGIVFSDETHASGTIEAVRIPSGGVRGALCEVDVTFDAEAGKLPGRIASVIADYDD